MPRFANSSGPVRALATCGALLGACGGEPAPRDAAVDVPAADVLAVDVAHDAGAPASLATWAATVLRLGAYVESNADLFAVAAAPDARCGRRLAGACAVTDCRVRDDAPRPRGVDLGEVAVSVPAGPAFRSAPDLDLLYPSRARPGVVAWAAGEPVTFTAGGGVDAPGFTQTLAFPADPLVSAPVAPDARTPYTIFRGQPLVARWTPQRDDVVVTVFQGQRTDVPSLDFLRIECAFGGGEGSGTLAPAVLSTLLPGARSGYSTAVLVASVASAEHDAGGRPVRVVAAAIQLTPAQVQ